MRTVLAVVTLGLVVAACASSTPTSSQTGTSQAVTTVAAATPAVAASTTPASTAQTTTAPAGGVLVAGGGLDDTHLVVGDQQYADAPTRGKVFACRAQQGQGGAGTQGPWFNGDGTWDLTKKVFVQGSVRWDQATATIEVQGDQRVVTSNGLPVDATTGEFPVGASDPAYAYDRNPNSITAQKLSFSLPAAPTVAATASCIGGEVGIAVNGVPIFNAFDAGGRDAGAWEVQDTCQGHPQVQGIYHYHTISDCLDLPGVNPSPLVGYAFDGFGIYGSRDANGTEIRNSDLDECHGIKSTVMWQGQMVDIYHYVATNEFPYTVGCLRGTSTVSGPIG